MNYKENMPIGKLSEHSENRKLFKDIKDTNPAFWLEFLDSIGKYGIIEPLIVNKNTMEIRSGNQRYLAALEKGLETIPVLLIDPEIDYEVEIQKMIASNVYRRTIDPFSMMEYIGRLRTPTGGQNPPSKYEIGKVVHKGKKFVSAADIFNAMPEEEQTAIKEWFKEKAEGEKAKTEGELIAQIRSLQENGLESENELKEARESLKSLEKELDTLSGNFSESKKELEEIRATATYEELQEREADLEKLREERAKLKNKIKEMKGTPDLNVLLIDCVSKQLQVNSVLKEVLANTASLNLAKLKEFEEAIKRTFEIIKSTKTKDQSGQRKKLND